MQVRHYDSTATAASDWSNRRDAMPSKPTDDRPRCARAPSSSESHGDLGGVPLKASVPVVAVPVEVGFSRFARTRGCGSEHKNNAASSGLH